MASFLSGFIDSLIYKKSLVFFFNFYLFSYIFAYFSMYENISILGMQFCLFFFVQMFDCISRFFFYDKTTHLKVKIFPNFLPIS